MAIIPDQPFPKTAGQIIRSKDWNDVVTEVQNLDNVKVRKAGDNVTGTLTINGSLGVGTTAPAAKVHLADSAGPAVLRIQSTAAGFGAARMELWSDPQGSGTEWRPAYVQSFDTGGFTGGLSFVTNGTGAAQRTGSVEAMRLVNGRVGIGVPAPGFKIDVSDRIRLRQGPSGSAGMWLFQTTPNADRAFIGMIDDNQVGLWGAGSGWALSADVNNGNVGVRSVSSANFALSVNGSGYVSGRLRDNKLRAEARSINSVSISTITNNTVWSDIPGMSLTIFAPPNPAATWFHLRFQMNGVQVQGVTQAHAEFQLLVDGVAQDFTLEEFHNNGWELRSTSLDRLINLSSGSHTVRVQWSVKSPQARPFVNFLIPEIRATLTGCFYGDSRRLMAIEL